MSGSIRRKAQSGTLKRMARANLLTAGDVRDKKLSGVQKAVIS